MKQRLLKTNLLSENQFVGIFYAYFGNGDVICVTEFMSAVLSVQFYRDPKQTTALMTK